MRHDLTRDRMSALLRERILVLEGPKGTMLQRHRLAEEDYRGKRFAEHPVNLRNNNEILNLVQPDLVEQIHFEFGTAGADIIATNTFNGNAISQRDFAAAHLVREMNLAGAALARRAADRILQTTGRSVFVAGTMGPTNRTASMSPDVGRPGYRNVDFDELADAYEEQTSALIEGTVDLLILETSFDTLNVKAALYAIARLSDRLGGVPPVIVSVTFSDKSGRTLSGQTLEAFWTSVNHYPLFAVGVNCGLGAAELGGAIEELSRVAWVPTVCYPNAGLPNALGEYDQSPAEMAGYLGSYVAEGWLNIVGGCCGSTPDHIRAIAEAVTGKVPRRPPARDGIPRYAGLDVLEVRPDSNFILVGERTNVAGSRRFAKLVRAGAYEEAVGVARQQVENGANILDVNMDEALLDSPSAMREFLRIAASEPDVARVPLMVDSSNWEVILAGLKATQGKCIVNSISLKDGERAFRERAREARRLGAALTVMAFDEQGQADTIERKVEICRRAYRILVEEEHVEPEEIIFDPNVLAIGTGIPEHAGYALAFIEAVRQIKRDCPGALCSGGISNLSFAFRGNDRIREALHAVFLYHAIHAGLDMGIVNAGQLALYEDVDPELRKLAEDLIFDRRPDATERLLDYASQHAEASTGNADTSVARSVEQADVDERIAMSLIHGRTETIEQEMAEALAKYGNALAVIEGPLMRGMRVIGDRFADGRMFLPQVVKSARTMKQAVAFLTPYMEKAESTGDERRHRTEGAARILLATVKGDVHDIGKNIVGVVLACAGHEIRDLGVMVPAQVILDTAMEWGADCVGLSGLITPSLDEMVHVAREMQRRGMTIPLLIGGATTSRTHTAVRIAPEYSGPVVHVQDASRAGPVVRNLMDRSQRDAFASEVRREQAELAEQFARRHQERRLLTIQEARRRAPQLPWTEEVIARPSFLGTRTVSPSVATIRPFIDWSPFLHVWDIRGRYPEVLDRPDVADRAKELLGDAERLLDVLERDEQVQPAGVYGFWEAMGRGDDIVLLDRGQSAAAFPMLRQQQDKGEGTENYCLADFVAPEASGLLDYVGLFVVTAGAGIHAVAHEYRERGDDYSAIMVEALADRLAEALAEWLHQQARRDCQFGEKENLSNEDLIQERYRGIRPAPGYPACPDHSEKTMLFELLDAPGRTGVTLTDTMAMAPPSSICGFYLNHPGARYFPVGTIGRDQLEDYASRRSMSVREVARWLKANLAPDVLRELGL